MEKAVTPGVLSAPNSKHARAEGNCQPAAPDSEGISLYPKDYRISVNGFFFTLGPPLFRLLQQLMSNRGRLLTRRQLLDGVWGNSVYIEQRTLDAHVQRLRKILAPFHKADLIERVNGAGYRFSEHRRLSIKEASP